MKETERVLITGASGQLGQEFLERIPKSYSVLGCSSEELDITNFDELEEKISSFRPDVLINCAAYTAVDQAEKDVEQCNAINTKALSLIGRLANEYNFKVLHFSTDYVFDGSGNSPWNEDDETEAINVYGLTKRKGELALIDSKCESLILRISGLYSEHGNNFPRTINRLLSERDELNVVNDQVSSPTWSLPLVDFVIDNLLCNAEYFSGKIYHYSEEGEGSWYEIAMLINEKYNKQINPVASSEYIQAARRPEYSKLDNTLAKTELGLNANTWQENLRSFLKIIQSK